jgi:hypothetical protein
MRRSLRKEDAAELMRRLKEGPMLFAPDSSFSPIPKGEAREKAKYEFNLWCETWIIPVVERLIPELKPKKVQ